MDKSILQQILKDIAHELEKECGNWQELPDTEDDAKLRKKIFTMALEHFNSSK